MSHISVSKLIGDRHEYAGSIWWYQFAELPRSLDEKAAATFVQRKRSAFSRLAKKWDDDLNSEWLVRLFFSAKMIMAATVMLGSLKYSRTHNLRVCAPYLEYYSVLYSLRSLVLALPDQEWRNGELLVLAHSKAINVACDTLKALLRERAEEIEKQILYLKAFRELISYRAPSSGDKLKKLDVDVVSTCRLLVELAQMMSELLERSLEKHLNQGAHFALKDDVLERAFYCSIEGFPFDDEEDAYRIGYFQRKHPLPANIMHMVSEGHVDDFFGTWCADQEEDGVFDPDLDCRLVFDFP